MNSEVAFNKPLIGPLLHVVNMDASTATISGTSTTGDPITVDALAKNDILGIVGNAINTPVRPALNNGCQIDGTGENISAGCGSIRLGANSGLIDGFSMSNVNGSTNTDGWYWSLSFPTAALTKQFAPTEITLGETSQLTFTIDNPDNSGALELSPLDFTDNFPAGVKLADETWSSNSCGAPTATAADGQPLAPNGVGVKVENISVAIGAVCTVTFNVTADAVGSYTNDNSNIETGVGNLIPNADTTLTVVAAPSFTVEKSASATSVVAGGTLGYAITVTNTGTLDFTSANPATFMDDLSAVLDDAVYNDDASNGAVVAGGVLSWSGALAAGESKTISYSVTVNDPVSGDGMMTNAVVPGAGGSCDSAADCIVSTPLQSFILVKSTTATEVVAGETVPYAITITNTGQADYTAGNPASFSDDLSAVLDDASYDNNADNGASYSDPVLSWSGALAVGESVTISYSVTVNDPATGDGVLTNTVVTPPGSGGDCAVDSSNLNCTAEVPGRGYTVAKSADKTEVLPGGTIVYTVTVENTGALAYTAAAPASFTDDLGAVLDDASYNGDASDGATVSGNVLSWSGALAVGQTKAITYSVTADARGTGDGTLTNTVAPTARGGDCDLDAECTTTTPVKSYTVQKSSDKATVVLGDTVGYSVTVTNTGQVAYTAADPASFTDDLSAVLDDASYNGDASNGATVTAGVLSWSGALAVGESVTVSYSVTVNAPASGDRVLTNVAMPDEEAGGECAIEGCPPVVTNVGIFIVEKSASDTTVMPGGVLVYTVTVTNMGAVAYTAADPASFTDELSAVLDDATYNDDASNGATVAGTVLSWSGALAVGASVDITYSVTVNSPNTGDGVLTNAVVPDASTGGLCETTAVCKTVTPLRSFEVLKVASASSALPGDTVSYTITVTNTGGSDYTAAEPASFTDNLADVLDDASYNDDASNGATVTGTVLSWSGPLAVGATQTITYSVTVGAPGTGDSVLRNAVVTPPNTGGSCEADSTDPACVTLTPVASFILVKSSDATTVTPGETVAYTVTVTNTGAVAYTEAAPASFTDDLSAVLDDAAYNDDATNGATYAAPNLSWSGALAVGESVTISYSFTVNSPNTGDSVLSNTVVSPPGTGGSCPTGSTNPECTVELPGPVLKLVKTQSSDSVLPGDTVVYTITVENTGDGDFTADNPASFSDDLAQVLDDATYNGDASNGATVVDGVLSWSGALASGATSIISYSVTVNAPSTGDHQLVNAVVTPPNVTSNCTEGSTSPDCTVTAKLASFTTSKTVDTTSAAPGDVVTYSITVSNTGQLAYTADAPAAFTDDLSKVLDDASYNGDASNGATVVDGVLSWSGELAVGATTVISYSVTVKASERGDHQMVNAVIPDASTGGFCAEDGVCETTTEVSSYSVAKTVSTESAKAGDTVDYTITVKNTGRVAFTEENPASFVDDLSEVLDDAAYNGDASDGTSYLAPLLSWTGELPVGETVEVTYSVTLNKNAGDGVLRNVVMAPPSSGSDCVPGAENQLCETETVFEPVPDVPSKPLASTGVRAGIVAALSAMLLALGGGVLFLTRRRRQNG